MNRTGYVLVAASAAWLLYIYLGYPVCLWILSFFRRVAHIYDDSYLPSVTVLIAARNEQQDIEWKVRQTLAWDYPEDRLQVFVASDASDDQTDDILRSITDPRLRYIRMEVRGGKVSALNCLARLADSELLFFTDANSDVGPWALRRIVRHFADSRVGCVTGADRTAPEEIEKAIGSGEKAYWAYELTIDELESQLGSVLVCFGAIHCIRRSLFVECDPDLANDLETPIRIGNVGQLVLFEPGAISVERATQNLLEEFNRRRRICGQGALSCFRLLKCINGLRAWQFVSRKALRWLAALPLLGLLCGSALLAERHSWALLLLVCQCSCYVAAGLGWAEANRNRGSKRIFAIPFYFVLVNLAALIGVVDACSGRRYATWGIASLTRGRVVTDRAANRPA